MKVLEQTSINEATKILSNGGLISFPTETVFGLGVVFDNKDAYDRLISVKRRPPEKPFTMMLSDIKDLGKYIEIDEICKILIEKYMPGQITIIGKAQPGLPSWCVSKEGTVGVRIPDIDIIRNMIRLVGKPLLVPSANKSGEQPCNSDQEVALVFKNEIDAVVKGESKSKIASTIVLINGKIANVIREGFISKQEIEETISKGQK